MTPSNRRRCFQQLLAAAAVVLTWGMAQAQTNQIATADTEPAATPYEPEVGQFGKDVVWVPTAESLVDQMLRMAAITPRDYLIDLGSGDGRTVITAAQRGTRAHGIEFNPDLVKLSRQAARQAGVSDKATFAEGDIFESDFSAATVVTLFLLPQLNLRLRPGEHRKPFAGTLGTVVVDQSQHPLSVGRYHGPPRQDHPVTWGQLHRLAQGEDRIKRITGCPGRPPPRGQLGWTVQTAAAAQEVAPIGLRAGLPGQVLGAAICGNEVARPDLRVAR